MMGGVVSNGRGLVSGLKRRKVGLLYGRLGLNSREGRGGVSRKDRGGDSRGGRGGDSRGGRGGDSRGGRGGDSRGGRGGGARGDRGGVSRGGRGGVSREERLEDSIKPGMPNVTLSPLWLILCARCVKPGAAHGFAPFA